jgi:NhaP-type Na+/H+ or K+/H+ antiporter
MNFEGWYLLLGSLMLLVSFVDRYFKRLPITTTIVYLAVGLTLGPIGLGVVYLDPLANSQLLERVSELAVIVSLFTAGLKLRVPLSDRRWKLPVRLASLSMALTVGLTTLLSVFLLDLPLAVGVLLGAILAPTDPVLASDVQVEDSGDRDRLRFGLTGEAGLNDGTAFPFVMLGVGLLGVHELGSYGWRWFTVDLVWAVGAGLLIGGLLGTGAGRLVLYLRARHQETVGRDEFLALGLIAAAYGAALLLHAYGFLAVFAAGLALRRIEMNPSSRSQPVQNVDSSPDQETTAAVAHSVLQTNEHFERVLEITLVLMLGMMITPSLFTWPAALLSLAMFLVIRPLSVLLGTFRVEATPVQRTLICWFGIRGIGSIYYLMHALQYQLPPEAARTLTDLTLAVILASIFIHGISVTPIMNLYEARRRRRNLQS